MSIVSANDSKSVPQSEFQKAREGDSAKAAESVERGKVEGDKWAPHGITRGENGDMAGTMCVPECVSQAVGT